MATWKQPFPWQCRTSLALAGLLALPLILGACSIRCTVHECCPTDAPNRIRIDIPDPVHAAVLKVLPGFVASEFEVESKDGAPVYELEGVSEGKRYEVLVDAQGNVLRIDEELDEDLEDASEDTSEDTSED